MTDVIANSATPPPFDEVVTSQGNCTGILIQLKKTLFQFSLNVSNSASVIHYTVTYL
jgi:hypothetical protein